MATFLLWAALLPGIVILTPLADRLRIPLPVLDLESISTMGSAGFLIIFAVVNVAEARTAGERGSSAWISVVAAVACTAALAALIARSRPGAVFVLIAMVTLSFGIEAVFRKFSGRALKV